MNAQPWKETRINWRDNGRSAPGSALAEIGGHKLLVSQIADDPLHRWVWTHDLPVSSPQRRGLLLHGIEKSRQSAMSAAAKSAIGCVEGMAEVGQRFAQLTTSANAPFGEV